MKSFNLISFAYAILTIIAIVLIMVYWHNFKDRPNKNGLLAFIAISIINFGYFLLSCSRNLTLALLANDVAYLGTITLLVEVFIIINDFCNLRINKLLTKIVIICSILVFALVVSGGTDIKLYYVNVDLDVVNNIGILIKEYGPLHILYTIYVVLVFLLMIIICLYTMTKRKLNLVQNVLVLIVLASENIFVWFVERFADIDFELLAVSYVLTESIFLLLFKNEKDYDELNELIDSKNVLQENKNAQSIIDKWIKEYALTEREIEVLKLLIENIPRSDIAKTLYISEHTVKKHTTHIYEKLNVTSRNDLLYKLNEEISN